VCSLRALGRASLVEGVSTRTHPRVDVEKRHNSEDEPACGTQTSRDTHDSTHRHYKTLATALAVSAGEKSALSV
jgi:hypothetical protein